MKISVFLSALCVGALASDALAYDLSIKGGATETVDGSDNYFLEKSPSGITVRSQSAINLDILAQTPTTQYLLDTNFSYFKYFGPGAENTQLTWGTPASALFSADHTTQLEKYHFAASWRRQDIATTQLEESGVASSRGTTNTYNVSTGVTRDLSRVDTVTWSASGSTASSTDPGFTPYFDFTSAVAWRRTLGPTTTLNTSINFDWYSADNAANSQRLFWKVMTGLSSRLTRRLSVNGNVGMIFVNAWQDGPVQSVAPLLPSGIAPFAPLVGTANSILWDVGLQYNLLKATSVSLTAAQVVFPTITGQLQKSETFGVTLTHAINSMQNVALLARFTQSSSGAAALSSTQSAKSEFFTASINYSYRLTRDWRTNLTYTYNQRNDSSGSANANVVLFRLSYDFNVLGNPTAINVAQRERARERAQSAVGYAFPKLY